MVAAVDVTLLSLASFLGTVGVSLTGFGHAIVYLFVWQIAVLLGYDSNFKYAVFIQALALFSAQPILLYKAEIREFASRRMLYYFIPITILSTPIGQITGDRVSTDLVETVGGVLVTFVAVFEIYQKRELFLSWFCSCLKPKNEPESVLIETKNLASQEETEGSETSESSGKVGVDRSFYEAFSLEQKLGEGSFSVVKVGRNKESGQSFAIKIVTKAKLLEVEEVKLKEEISLMQEISHPNILGLIDVFDEHEHYFLVTEMMSGGDLLSRLNGLGFFDESQGRRIAKSILEAVSYLHSKKIAHRDLKPENLLLDSDSNSAVVKLADFGFAKKEKEPNSFSTMCGTPAYVAPEILKGLTYGLQADLWSIGVIVYVLLAGYQPFRGDEEAVVNRRIQAGEYEFHKEFWGAVSDEAKHFISSLLKVDPTQRLDAKKGMNHRWFSLKDINTSRSSEDTTPVFFMIGSQRSGSNWLRTMLDEREDLAGPHPPHMMRDFVPIMDKFGDLSVEENFRVLVDHMCTFVERNQVPWTDKHGVGIKFPRTSLFASAVASCDRLRKNRDASGDQRPLEGELYLLSIFDAIMNFYTKANGKRMWMCKSMGMSKFHDFLLEYYGEKKLRYIYLVRDPRDVALSFMNTPVGDCHYYAIIKKWTNLQEHALRVVKECPHLVHKLHYESILEDKTSVVKGVYEFIGERRFGGVKRQASVLFMNPTEDLIDGAKNGREAGKARTLSYQFQNLGRGQSFAKTQNQKWKHPVTGLKLDEIQLLESVAHEMMGRLGYATHLVGVTSQPTVFSETDIKMFDQLNKEGIDKMNEDLQKENPGDFERRVRQAEALGFPPELLGDWSESDDTMSEATRELMGTSYLTEADLEARLEMEVPKGACLADGRRFTWASATQRGYYPHEPDKPNQDAHMTRAGTEKDFKANWFAVFDGHGPDGHKCAKYAAETIQELFRSAVSEGKNVKVALSESHLTAHERMLAESNIDTRQSGTTAVTLLLDGDKCVISNVGDSACIVGSWTSAGAVRAQLLCTEHTPLRADERERIKKAGGLIMTVDQRDGLAPMNEDWDNCEALPRIWSAEDDKFPGCGFTRSIGDSIAHSLGVTARPEIFEHDLEQNSCVFIVASDGITQFMNTEEIVELTSTFKDPAEAARALIRESSKRWIEKGDYMDDITASVIFLDSLNFENSSNTDVELGLGMVAVKDGPVSQDTDADNDQELGFSAQFWTLFAGAASGFLGGLCGIRGPPIILYFLHPPYPVSFTKNSARATGACITAINTAMRVAYYLVDTLAFGGEDYFEVNDWGLYVSIVIFSILGVLIGSQLFELLKDSAATIRGILAIFLLMCGVSLLLSTFAHV